MKALGFVARTKSIIGALSTSYDTEATLMTYYGLTYSGNGLYFDDSNSLVHITKCKTSSYTYFVQVLTLACEWGGSLCGIHTCTHPFMEDTNYTRQIAADV